MNTLEEKYRLCMKIADSIKDIINHRLVFVLFKITFENTAIAIT